MSAASSGSVRNLSSCIAGDEDAAGRSLHLRFTPIGMLGAQPRCLELPRGIVKRLRDLDPSPGGHLSNESGLDAFGVGGKGGAES